MTTTTVGRTVKVFSDSSLLEATDYTMLKLVAVLLVLASSVNATYIQDHLENYDSGYHVLTSFCFASKDTAQAKLEYMIMYPTLYSVQNLFLIPEENWGYGKYSCDELSGMLSSEHIIRLHPSGVNSGCEVVYSAVGQTHYNCTNSIIMSSESPRRWYIAIARCGASLGGMDGLKVTHYGLHLTNGDSEDEAFGCFDENMYLSSSNKAQWTPAIILTAAALFKLL